ncbi:hypothetical protein TNIN_426951 [Trichonephila inaurata madagascariensis]|uniref:Uncharacterized protein n=1 Tax=Trichonephila inaurata madagascariensis TaxID=2747483 RepID=A0A8X7CEB9_9ARAC|nr:hypothetical protein TNIN_426951 [Trichonephila inaurata madagascariensis]
MDDQSICLTTQRLLFKTKKKDSASSINSSGLFPLTGRKTRLSDRNTSCASFRYCKRRGTVLEEQNLIEQTARFRWFIVSSMARISSPVAGCVDLPVQPSESECEGEDETFQISEILNSPIYIKMHTPWRRGGVA